MLHAALILQSLSMAACRRRRGRGGADLGHQQLPAAVQRRPHRPHHPHLMSAGRGCVSGAGCANGAGRAGKRKLWCTAAGVTLAAARADAMQLLLADLVCLSPPCFPVLHVPQPAPGHRDAAGHRGGPGEAGSRADRRACCWQRRQTEAAPARWLVSMERQPMRTGTRFLASLSRPAACPLCTSAAVPQPVPRHHPAPGVSGQRGTGQQRVEAWQ